MSCNDCVEISYPEWSTVRECRVIEHKKCGMGTIFEYKVSEDKTETYTLYDLVKNRELLLKVLKYAGDTYHWLPESLKIDHEIALSAAEQNIFIARDELPDKLLNDRDFVKKLPGDYMEIISPKLKDDVEIVLHFIKQCPYMIVHASERILELLSLKKETIEKEHDIKFPSGCNYGILSCSMLRDEVNNDLDDIIKILTRENERFKNGDENAITNIEHYTAYLRIDTIYMKYNIIGKHAITKLENLHKE